MVVRKRLEGEMLGRETQLAVGCLFSLCFPQQPLSIALLMQSAFAFCLEFFLLWGFLLFFFLYQDTCSLKITDSH